MIRGRPTGHHEDSALNSHRSQASQRHTFSAADVLAGVSVALVLIPQSLAYADLAGMPAYYGLYAAMLPPIAAAFFASSPYLQTGPVAMTSVLTFGALSAIAAPMSPRYVALAALLAIVVGVARAALGLTRFGWIAFLMSQPVLAGFTSAAAILIIASQLPTAFGVPAPQGGLLGAAVWTVLHPGSWTVEAMALSLLTVAVVLGGRYIHALFPGVLVALIVGLVFGSVAEPQSAMVGPVPSGLPPFSLALPWGTFPQLIVPGIIIALVGFAEPAAIARTFAAQDRQTWSADREFVSQGVANLAAGLSGGFPVGGSFSRSSLNRLAGGRSRWSGAITGLVVLAFMPVAFIIAPLPRAVLAGIVIAAVAKLVSIRPLLRMPQLSLPQTIVAWTTFAMTLLLAPRIEQAVIVGVGVAVIIHLWRELRVHVRTEYRDGTLRLEPKGVLFFASAPMLHSAFLDELAAHPEARRVHIDLRHLGRIDLTGALTLRELVREAEQAGLAVELGPAPPQAWRLIKRVFADNGADRR